VFQGIHGDFGVIGVFVDFVALLLKKMKVMFILGRRWPKRLRINIEDILKQ